MQRVWLFLVLFLTLSSSTQAKAPLPLEQLVKHSETQQVKISPDGSHLAVRKLYQGEHVLVFMSLKSHEVTGVLRFSGTDEVGNFYWANDKRVVAQIISRKAALETPVNYGALFAIDYDGTQGKNIFGWSAGERQTGSRIRKAEATYGAAVLIDPLMDDDEEVLISTYPWARDWETNGDVYRLNIYSGAKHRVVGLPQVGGRAFTDGHGKLLFANGTTRENDYQMYRKAENGWQEIEDPALKRGTPVGYDRANDIAYLVIDRKNQTEQLIGLDMKSGTQTPLFADQRSDIDGIIRDPKSGKPVGVYTVPEYPETHFFDEDDGFAALFRGMQKAFDGYNIHFTSFTRDGQKGVLKVSGDRLPGDYFMVDLPTKKVDFLLSSAQWLDPDDLNPMRADTFTTADGLQIGVYLTFPRDAGENLPMVVMPHGGPHARNYWGYDRSAQILSQNGYLVLQVNFRGSTGFGDAFYDAGAKEWGGKIQRDIADAAHWAIERGYADRNRICIFGASFGGYSALMNPIRYPDLYRCAAGYAGVYDLKMMFEKGDVQKRDRGISYLRTELSEDEDFLRENSPIYHLQKLKVPLFIAHGEKDERAPVAHAEALLDKLQALHKPVTKLIVPNEGHGFYSEANNRKLYRQLLAFFDRYIGTGSEDTPATEGTAGKG
ncbi:S9 family peptidase [Microbulbifer sp. SAOS-129_SWC]|uniref:alpha/beta hydrolase family protein n=1 Tax=Microbulbifer sp. SAOS-129_SWC TaxID=3145235 RepID=UPI0032180490